MIARLLLGLVLQSGDVEQRRDVVYVRIDQTALHMDLALPAPDPDDTALRPALLYVHGGAWRAGSRADGHDIIERYAEGGYVAASIEYRLVDRAHFPSTVGDVEDAVRYLRGHAAELRIDPERIGILGHAAGANLAALVALTGAPANPEFGEGAGAVSSHVACAGGFAIPSNLMDPALGDADRAVVDAYLGDPPPFLRDARARGASPITWVDPTDPPFIIVHGTADEHIPIAHAEALHAALRGVGVETEFVPVAGAGHRFRDAEAERRVAQFFDRHLGGHAAALSAPAPEAILLP